MLPSQVISLARNQSWATTDIVTPAQAFQLLNIVEEDFRWDICNEWVGDKMNTFNINIVSWTNTYPLPASAAAATLLTSTFWLNQSVKVWVKLRSTDTYYTPVEVKYVEWFLKMDDYYQASASKSNPKAYLVGSDSIVIFPMPDTSITNWLQIMWPKAVIPKSASTEDIEGMIIIPPSAHPVLIEWLKYWFYGNMWVNFDDRRLQTKQFYESEKLRVINQLMNKNILADEAFIPNLANLGEW